PSPSDAALVIRAYLTGDDLTTEISPPGPEVIAQAAELCGSQPLALRAVGERARATSGGLGEEIRVLRASGDRLTALAYGDRDIGERISSEYRQLRRREQLALQALSSIEASTFVPWVLQPLLNTDLREAANLMAALSTVGLLDELPADPSG